VALTVRATEADREQCLEAGMDSYLDSYLSKPMGREELEELLSELSAGRVSLGIIATDLRPPFHHHQSARMRSERSDEAEEATDDVAPRMIGREGFLSVVTVGGAEMELTVGEVEFTGQ